MLGIMDIYSHRGGKIEVTMGDKNGGRGSNTSGSDEVAGIQLEVIHSSTH